MNKFQKELAKLRKKGKFDNKTYYKLYPSDAILPQPYGVIKVHKPEKNYTMRITVSTIGTVTDATSEHLAEIIQPTLNRNKPCVINPYTFVQKAKTWELYQDEVQVSCEIVKFISQYHFIKQ